MALDVGIAKIGIFCFVFLIAFAGLLALIPSGFNTSTIKKYSDVAENIPDYWNGINIGGYNFSDRWNFTLIETSTSGIVYTNNLGGRELGTLFYHFVNDGSLRLYHRYGLGLLFHEDLLWYNQKAERVSDRTLAGTEILTQETLDDEFLNNNNLIYEVTCLGEGGAWFFGSSSYFKVTVIFTFNETLYDNTNEAWSNDDLDVMIGINPEFVNLSKDIWFLVTSILTFNTAEIFGTNTPNTWQYVLNYIISGSIWAGILTFAGVIALEIWTAIFP